MNCPLMKMAETIGAQISGYAYDALIEECDTDCAWYDDEHEQCAVMTLTKAMMTRVRQEQKKQSGGAGREKSES